MLWPLDCFAALAMTVELTQQCWALPAKAGIQTWPRVPGLWIPAFAVRFRGNDTTLKDLILNDAHY